MGSFCKRRHSRHAGEGRYFPRERHSAARPRRKTTTMKTTLKSTLTALSLAIFAVFAFSGCVSTGGSSGSGTHHMDTPKRGSTMPDSAMPNR